MIGFGLFDTSINTVIFDTVAQFRSVNFGLTNAAYILGLDTENDGGGGLFFLRDAVAVSEEVYGLYLVADDGSGWVRDWDGRNANAAWFGAKASPSDLTGPDNSPVIARLPKFAITHWPAGRFRFASAPTEDAWRNTFHRGMSTVFQMTGAMTVSDIFMCWSFQPSEAFGQTGDVGSSIGLQNISDLTQTAMSPIEGVVLVGPGLAQGIGFAMGNTPGVPQYFTKPRNFSSENFYVGFGVKFPVRNLFLTGFTNCVAKGCAIGFDMDNQAADPAQPGAVNSGENMTLDHCVTSNITEIAVRTRKLQRLTIVGGSLDYSKVMIDAENSLVMVQNVYIESNANRSPAAWFKARGVAHIDIDESTIIYCLPGPTTDLFECSDSASIDCRATFCSNASATTINRNVLYTGASKNVRGKLKGANAKNYPPLLSKHLNLIADGYFESGTLDFMRSGAGETFQATIVSDVVRPGMAYAVKLSSAVPEDGARLAFRPVRVEPGKWLFFSYWDKLVGTIVNVANRIQWRDLDGNALGDPIFVGGAALPPNFSPTSISTKFNNLERDWTLQRAVAQVPTGAYSALIQVRIDPNSPGSYYASEAQAYL